MLGTVDSQYQQLIAVTPCYVQLPSAMSGFFEETGLVAACELDKRRAARMRFRCRAVLEFLTALPCLPRQGARGGVFMRDLSQQGAGLLYHEQVYPEEQVLIYLPQRQLEGTIAYCRRLGPSCYDVGLVLNRIHRAD